MHMLLLYVLYSKIQYILYGIQYKMNDKLIYDTWEDFFNEEILLQVERYSYSNTILFNATTSYMYVGYYY